jgi:hypothetical protein
VIQTEEEGFSEDDVCKPSAGRMVSISLFNNAKSPDTSDIEMLQRQLKAKEEHILDLT